VVTSATTTTAAMAAFLVSFFLISRSYVRSQAAPVVQVTLTREAVLDLPMYLSSCENSPIVLQVQGIFANALSVDGLRSQHNSRPGCFRVRAFSIHVRFAVKPVVKVSFMCL